MKHYIIDHLFEFWEYIGARGNFSAHNTGYKYTKANNMSWPSKVFGIDEHNVNLENLHAEMENGGLPNSVGIVENEEMEKRLLSHHFHKKSVVKGMFLKLNPENKPTNSFTTITQVDSKKKATEFALVASKSFGYEIHPSTIINLLNAETRIRLYLGHHEGTSVNCGIIFLDMNKISGIHMIGTIDQYRGLGLGKKMTNKLLDEAYKNGSDQVVLVASKAGERIYSKLGFISEGKLGSYSVKKQ